MTPKQKAEELFNKMDVWQLVSVKVDMPNIARELAKKYTLVAVDEIIKEVQSLYHTIEYWQEVKQEIEKL